MHNCPNRRKVFIEKRVRKKSSVYFCRDKTGLEVDCLMEQSTQLIPIEIKFSQTIHPDFFTSLSHFCTLADLPLDLGYVIYGGSEEQKRKNGHVLGWEKSIQLG